MEAEALELDAERVQGVVGEDGRDGLRDHGDHLPRLVDGDAGAVGRLVEESAGHVFLGRRLEIGGKKREDQPIGLARISLLEIGHVLRQGSPRLEPSRERGRGRTALAAHAQPPGRLPQGAAMPLDGQATVEAQRLRGHRRGDGGVSVTVAAYPRGEGEPAARGHELRVVRVQSAFKVRGDGGHGVPEDRIHEVEPGPHLVGHGRTRGAGAIGEPERGDLGAQRRDLGRALAREQTGIVQAPQHLAHALELGQDGAALGFRRMRGEHQLDPEPVEERGHLPAREAADLEQLHRLSDRLADRGWVKGLFPGAQSLDTVPFLGEIDQIEVDGKGGGGGPRCLDGKRRDHLGQPFRRRRLAGPT